MRKKITFHQKVLDRIDSYKPQGGLDNTSRIFIHMVSVKHPEVRDHCERVALLAEAVAIKQEKDAKAAFFGGLLHDIGKALLPSQLFDGHDISAEEYADVKEHAYIGFKVLKDIHLFIALCSGAHHAMRKMGYGVCLKDFPQEWGLATLTKVLEIAIIISICDFIDAFTHRKTEIRDGSNAQSQDLKGMLEHNYPDHKATVRIALTENTKLKM